MNPRTFRQRFVAITVISSLLVADVVLADALVVTQAMKASTIAEIFVEESEIRVEIEVGGQDIAAFRNLLPDELFEKVTGEVIPVEDRLLTFLESDWLIRADDRQLAGIVDDITLARRIIRDEITGDPLPNQNDDAEIVIRAKIVYPLGTQPKTLSIQPPESDDKIAQANIGFVVYHQGVAVNDFRYLSQEEKLRLDWSDPWYTAFDRKTLRRRYFAPAAAFIYVENFEVRKEIVFRPKDLQDWVDLGLAGKSTIDALERNAVCERAAAYLGEHTPVKIDSKRFEGTLDRVNFIERSLRTAGVVQSGQDIDINRAMIGAIYVYPTQSLPENVTMEWELFSDRIAQVPTVVTDQAGGMPGSLEPDNHVLVWQNFLKNPTIPAFLDVTPPAQPKVLPISLITVACITGVVFLWLRRSNRLESPSSHHTGSILFSVVLLAIAIGANYWPRLRVEVPLQRERMISDAESGDITYGLLHNVYRAFDYRDESTIYDVLNRSVSGDLLTRIYLETRESLTLASQGGARVKVNDVDLVSCTSQPAEGGSFVASCKWTVTGSVGHWGHIHQRQNQYSGEFRVQAIDGQWKFTDVELLSEERL